MKQWGKVENCAAAALCNARADDVNGCWQNGCNAIDYVGSTRRGLIVIVNVNCRMMLRLLHASLKHRHPGESWNKLAEPTIVHLGKRMLYGGNW